MKNFGKNILIVFILIILFTAITKIIVVEAILSLLFNM